MTAIDSRRTREPVYTELHDARQPPQDLAAELYAHTGDGHVTFDYPVTVSGSIDRSRIHGTLNGGGPQLEISSGDGSIRIAKY